MQEVQYIVLQNGKIKILAARLHRKVENIIWQLAPTFPIVFTLLDSSKNDLWDYSRLIYVMKCINRLLVNCMTT